MTRALFAAGALILLGAVGWWWLTYRDVVGYAYMDLSAAGACLVGDSDTCRLARALCRGAHPLALAAYRAAAFWAGIALLSAGLTAGVRRRA
ncbi:hypothetical protein [Labrys wisconsinensis]|uniref:Uncharacterized protein n=1 Tax=Labrys wisconsinensis TaxID=425677 RepID=A0ABU0JCH4_9HYPH|nr:hypothetical protein [Labrys wisconsinensis]MDQ0471984.1 hypothetical protein [Labrys wisconsinensis]